MIKLFTILFLLASAGLAAAGPATQPADKPGEQIPSEDPVIKDLHSLGLIDGQTDIFRSACPVRDLAKQASAATQPAAALQDQANARMKHLYDLGIRTDICFQNPDDEVDAVKKKELETSLAMEKQAAKAAGIDFVYRPMKNGGPDSLQTMSDQAVYQWVDSIAREIVTDSKTGGVLFHCSAGHDRTGIEAAFLRMKYQHWPVEQAIAEMRRLGHNWPKYSDNGGESSWHEEHLRAIAKLMESSTTRP
jgi:protein tyrosine phosphatase (PTP) superfamily phosphohydrolase (DUF442 family)